MTTEYAHYFASLRLLQQVRWAIAACLVILTSRLLAVSARLLPELHPARPILLARVEANKRTLLPCMGLGLPTLARRLGQGAMLAAVSLILVLSLLGMAHATYHFKHRHDPAVRVRDVFTGR